jgi:hypothetical protein
MFLYMKFPFALFCFFSTLSLLSQKPEPHSRINHTTVYFENEFVMEAKHYELLISVDTTMKNVLHHLNNDIPAFWVEDLKWDGKYYWKTLAFDGAGNFLKESNIYSFKTQKKIDAVYIADTRLDIKVNKYSTNTGGFIVLDHARGIFDRKGKQVWALPDLGGLVDDRKLIRDMNVSPYNTITLLAGPIPVEIDFEGRVLWKAPYPMVIGNDTIIYHHDFKRHSNGHYFVLGNKKVVRKVLGNFTQDSLRNESNLLTIADTLYKKTLHGLLLEFDESANLVWYWDSKDYLQVEDLNYKKSESGLPTFGSHMNAFSVNRDNTKAYVGFRDLNRIVKIDKKKCTVEYSYGEKYPSGEAKIGHNLFKGQHDATITNRGTILVFNNNNSPFEGSGSSSVLEIMENAKAEKDLLLWKFNLDFDSLTNGKSTSAGNISELPNGNLLVCGGVMPRILEVSKTKEIVWDAFPYSNSISDTTFSNFAQYRSHWTPQLFYYHFLVKFELKVSEDANNIFLKIDLFNTGNTSDSYLVEVISENENMLYSKKTTYLSSNEKAEIKIKSLKTKSNSLTLHVSSLSNKFLSKTILLK